MLKLDYSFSDFGSISVPFHKESKQIIDFLQKAEDGGLRHFERLDHLGRLRDAHRSAHHSRWEYMMLQMFLFHQFKEAGTSFGFGGSIRLSSSKRISSSEELFKCWTLLLNFGHLAGTFECERAWFEILKENSLIYDKLLNDLPDEECKKLASKIFESENYYKFSSILSLFLLNFYKGKSNFSQFPIEEFILILKKYLIENPRSSAINRCKNIFQKIRRIAYILLDCTFSSSFMKINPKIFFDYILANPNEVLYEDYSSFNMILNSVEMELFNVLYASEVSSLIKLKYLSKKKREIQDAIDKDPIEFANQLPNNIVRAKYHDPTSPGNQEIRLLIRLNFIPTGEYFERSECRYYSEQKKIYNRVSFNRLFPFITPTPGKITASMLDIFCENSISINLLRKLIWTISRYMESIYSDWKFEPYILQTCIEDPAEDIFLFLLGRIISKNHKFRFKDTSSPDDYNVNLLFSKSEMRRWNERILEETKNSGLQDSRKKEIECLRQLVKREKSGILLILHCNVIIYDESWREIGEWDGVYFRILKRAIYVTILEAKRGITARSQEAKEELMASFERIGIKIDESKIPIRNESIRGKNVGFSYLRSDIRSFP